jgi:molecular chaperone DnaJ
VARLNVRIPAGINQNEAIRLSGQGEAGPKGAEAGDLYLKIRINPDKRFKRQDYDIISEQTIGFSQAAIGDKIEIETVDGPVTLKIPEGTQSGKVFMLRGKGVPKLHSHGRGDHLVTIIVKTPTGLSRQQRKILEDLGI